MDVGLEGVGTRLDRSEEAALRLYRSVVRCADREVTFL